MESVGKRNLKDKNFKVAFLWAKWGIGGVRKDRNGLLVEVGNGEDRLTINNYQPLASCLKYEKQPTASICGRIVKTIGVPHWRWGLGREGCESCENN